MQLKCCMNHGVKNQLKYLTKFRGPWQGMQLCEQNTVLCGINVRYSNDGYWRDNKREPGDVPPIWQNFQAISGAKLKCCPLPSKTCTSDK